MALAAVGMRHATRGGMAEPQGEGISQVKRPPLEVH